MNDRTDPTASKILIVDDQPMNITLLQTILAAEGFSQIKGTTQPREVKSLVAEGGFDLVVLDLRMPEMDGFQVIAQLKQIRGQEHLPILVISGDKDKQTLIDALGAGANDFINKPFQRFEVIARIKSLLNTRSVFKNYLQLQNMLEEKVRERTREVQETRVEIINRLGRAAEFRDNETGMHVVRMSKFSHRLALAAGLSTIEAELILQAAPMHDVGKIGISDLILLKPGKLDAHEFTEIMKHPEIGAHIIGNHPSDLFRLASQITLHHHERWNGSGYPYGLRGEDIPLAARIVAICDVFDALTSSRPYKKPWNVPDAVALINADSGKHFDPGLVPVFNGILPEILEIRARFSDEAADAPTGRSVLNHSALLD